MTDPFLAEIRMFAGDYAPTGWALCNGQLVPIAQNTALFSLLGTTYGGDGRTTFALPDLLDRAPMQPGAGQGLTQRTLGEQGGQSAVTLQSTEMPAHTHSVAASTATGTANSPSGSVLGVASSGRRTDTLYAPQTTAPDTTMNPSTVGASGQSTPHNNMPPYTAVTFIIALQGIFPTRP